MLFAVQFLGGILVTAIAIVVYVSMQARDTSPEQPAEPPLPDGNQRGDELLTWAAQFPDRTLAPDYPHEEDL